MALNYVAQIIIDSMESQTVLCSSYIDEKREVLKDTNKFQALLYLNNCDVDTQRDVAKRLGITHGNLYITIKTLQYC